MSRQVDALDSRQTQLNTHRITTIAGPRWSADLQASCTIQHLAYRTHCPWGSEQGEVQARSAYLMLQEAILKSLVKPLGVKL